MPLPNAWPRRARRAASILAAIVALGLLGGCNRASGGADGWQLRIVHTNDTMGVAEPCG